MLLIWIYLYAGAVTPESAANSFSKPTLVQLIGNALSTVFASSVDCNVVGQHLSVCTERYNVEPLLVKGIPFFANVSEFPRFCSQVEELLSCFHGIFGRCSVMYYDFDAYNATFYDVCQDISFAINAFDGCIDQTNYLIEKCMKQYRSETLQLYRDLPGQFLTPAVQCGIYTSLRKCLVWNVTSSCLPPYRSFLTSVFQRRFTPTLCKDIYSLQSQRHSEINSNRNNSTGINSGLVHKLDLQVLSALLVLQMYIFTLSRLSERFHYGIIFTR